jgi:hypothetical protein
VKDSRSIIPIVISEGDLRNPERLAMIVQAMLYKHRKNSQFLITIPERSSYPIVTGSQDFDDDI